MTDYKSQLQIKVREYEELSQQFSEFQQQSNLIINDLQEELKQLKRKNEILNRQISEQKEKAKCFKSSIEREVELAQRERNQFKKKFIEFEKKVIELEIVNETLESDLRATKSTLEEYESRTQKTMEELAIVRIEIEETQENNKELVARLKNQLKEAEEELYSIHRIKEKKQEAKEAKEKHDSHLGQSEIGISEITPTNTNVFKETLKGIRQYMSTLDARKLQVRKLLLRA